MTHCVSNTPLMQAIQRMSRSQRMVKGQNWCTALLYFTGEGGYLGVTTKHIFLSGSPNQLFHNVRMLNKPSEIADCQNEFFVNKVQQIREYLPAQVSDPLAKLRLLMRNRNCSFHLKPAHPDTAEKIVSGLKNSK